VAWQENHCPQSRRLPPGNDWHPQRHGEKLRDWREHGGGIELNVRTMTNVQRVLPFGE